eukprot:3557576-Karenia_brevis.AAC.1
MMMRTMMVMMMMMMMMMTWRCPRLNSGHVATNLSIDSNRSHLSRSFDGSVPKAHASVKNPTYIGIP